MATKAEVLTWKRQRIPLILGWWTKEIFYVFGVDGNDVIFSNITATNPPHISTPLDNVYYDTEHRRLKLRRNVWGRVTMLGAKLQKQLEAQ